MSEEQTPGLASRLRTALLPELIFVVVLPYLIYRLASAQLPGIYALLLAGIAPALRILLGLARYRRLNTPGIFSLLVIALNIIGALLFKNEVLLLIGAGALVTGTLGIIMLASVLLRRPLLLTLAKYALANNHDRRDRILLQHWQAGKNAGYRSSLAYITALWGAGLLLECILRIVLALRLPAAQFLLVSPIVRYGILGILALVTLLMVRMRRARYREAKELASQAQLEETTPHPTSP